MDEPTTGTQGWTRRDWLLVALTVLLAGIVRFWQLAHTEVAARDSIGFIRVAWQLGQTPLADWPRVIARVEQHPGYPLAILGAQRLLAPMMAEPAEQMRLAAQMVSVLASLILVFPAYALGRELFDRRAGFALALLLHTLPVNGRILSDGLSEALFLVFAISSFFWSFRALSSGSPWAFGLTGLFGGLAYLTRPEGLFIVPATVAVLLAGQILPGWRLPWRQFLASGVALSLGALMLAGPFVAVTGRLTVKPSGQRVIRDAVSGGSQPQPQTRGPLLAWWGVEMTPDERVGEGLRQVGWELLQGSFYVGWLFALLGLWLHGTKLKSPGVWPAFLVALGVAIAVWRVAVVVGYVSERHLLLVLLAFLPWAVAGLLGLGEAAARHCRLSPRASLILSTLFPLAFVAAGLPKTLRPLHEHRAGFRAAGVWLRDNARPTDEILDPFCWSHYYAHRVFLEGTRWPELKGQPRREFIVLERAGNDHPRLGAVIHQAKARASQGVEVFRWSGQRGKRRAEVLVYEVRR